MFIKIINKAIVGPGVSVLFSNHQFWCLSNYPISKQRIYFSTAAAFASTTKLRKMAIKNLLPDWAAKNRMIPGRTINRKTKK
jgi:hypothetical protein